MITRSEQVLIARGDMHINLHRHDGPDGTHSLGISSFGPTFIDFSIQLTAADMLSLATSLRSIVEGPNVDETIETQVRP